MDLIEQVEQFDTGVRVTFIAQALTLFGGCVALIFVMISLSRLDYNHIEVMARLTALESAVGGEE